MSANADRIQVFQERLDLLETRMQDLVAEVELRRREIDAEGKYLRQEICHLCLGTVADLAVMSLRHMETTGAEWGRMQTIMQ